ncbi:MAG: hypothetical protein HC881_00170 [Leptolyngbyaceae cyanobacterium SL_7_1]|nr:hypothetical protein [Leptolyngbyaceae cyanobacterium SL_7_1]
MPCFNEPRSIARSVGGMTALQNRRSDRVGSPGGTGPRPRTARQPSGQQLGGLGLPPQPTNEQFENRVAMQWSHFHPDRPLWLEAESKRIGLCRIPAAIFQQMEQATVLEILRPRQERLDLLVKIYGTAAMEDLVAATQRIGKRLGGLRTQQAIALLREGKLAEAFDLILDYYDKTYRYDLERRRVSIQSIDAAGLSDLETAQRLIHQYRHGLAEPIALPIAQ